MWILNNVIQKYFLVIESFLNPHNLFFESIRLFSLFLGPDLHNLHFERKF